MNNKVYNRGTDSFKSLLAELCDIMPIVRAYALQVDRIEEYDAGMKFYNEEGKNIITISRTTLTLAQRNYNATFND